MGALRAEITNHQCQIGRQLALQVQIPRLHVGVVEATIHRLWSKPGGASHADGVVQAYRSAEDQRHGQRRVPARAAHHARHGLIDEDRISPTNHYVTVVKRIPGETESWLKVVVVLVVSVIEIHAGAEQRGLALVKNNESVVAFAGRHIPLVPYAKFESQIRSPPVTVLHEKTERTLGDAAGLIAQRHAERVRGAIEEGGNGREVERTCPLSKVVVEKLPVFTAKLDRVFPEQPGQRIRGDEGGVTAE